MVADKRGQGLRRLPGDRLDIVGNDAKTTVLMILSRGRKVRRKELGEPDPFDQSRPPLLDWQVHILDLLSKLRRRNFGHIGQCQILGAREGIPLSEMRCRVLKDCQHYTRLRSRRYPHAVREAAEECADSAGAGRALYPW